MENYTKHPDDCACYRCWNKRMKDIEETGCNFGAEMELKSGKNLVEVNKIREESNERLRNFLY